MLFPSFSSSLVSWSPPTCREFTLMTYFLINFEVLLNVAMLIGGGVNFFFFWKAKSGVSDRRQELNTKLGGDFTKKLGTASVISYFWNDSSFVCHPFDTILLLNYLNGSREIWLSLSSWQKDLILLHGQPMAFRSPLFTMLASPHSKTSQRNKSEHIRFSNSMGEALFPKRLRHRSLRSLTEKNR